MRHGFDALHTAHTVYEHEVDSYPKLKGLEHIILVAAGLESPKGSPAAGGTTRLTLFVYLTQAFFKNGE